MRRRVGLLAALLLFAGWFAWLLVWGPKLSDVSGLYRGEPAADALDALDAAVDGEPGVDAPSLRGRATARAEGSPDDAAGMAIRGQVIASDTQGLHRLRVHLVALSDRARKRKAPDDEGWFRFENLEPGRYRLDLLVPHGLLGSSVEVEVADRDVEVELRLRDPVEARIKVVDETGAPIVGALVSTDRVAVRTDEEGVAFLRRLDPERIEMLTARPPEDSAYLEQTIEDWSVGDTRIVLERGLEIRGRVVDEEGKPVVGAVCWFSRGRESEFRGVTTEADGRFRISGLRPGLVRIQAELGGDGWPAPPSRSAASERVAEVEPGTDDVELVVRRGAQLTVRITGWPGSGKGRCRLCVSGGNRPTRWRRLGEDGIVRFRGLDAGATYEVWATLGPGVAFAHTAAVRPGPDVVALPLQEGQSITVRVERPEKAEVEILSVRAGRGAVTVRALPHPDVAKAAWTTSPLPPGRWRVSAYGRPLGESTGRVHYGASGEAEAGGTITLKLERVER